MEEETAATYYPSKRDAWIVAVLWVALAAMAFGFATVMTAPGPPLVRLGTGAALLAAAGLCIWIMNSTGYTLTEKELLIRSGPLRTRIDLESLDQVTPSRIALSSPALSLDRLRLRTRRNRFGVLISPEHKHAFVQQLLAYCPHLVRVGELSLRRRVD